MKKLFLTLMYLIGHCFLCSPAWSLYKYIDADGTVTFTDILPDSKITVIEEPNKKPIRRYGSNQSQNEIDPAANLPYALKQAAINFPVTIFSRVHCDPCDQGKQLLIQRGIPFQEKLISNDDDLYILKLESGDTGLPVLSVGRNIIKGFEANDWHNALDIADYPRQNRLPSNYRLPAPQAAAPKKSDVLKVEPTNSKINTSPPVSEGNAPPGFKF